MLASTAKKSKTSGTAVDKGYPAQWAPLGPSSVEHLALRSCISGYILRRRRSQQQQLTQRWVQAGKQLLRLLVCWVREWLRQRFIAQNGDKPLRRKTCIGRRRVVDCCDGFAAVGCRLSCCTANEQVSYSSLTACVDSPVAPLQLARTRPAQRAAKYRIVLIHVEMQFRQNVQFVAVR